MAKCDPHEICEECPEWIFTLADLLMCMMGLFVIMWVLKPSGSDNPVQATAEELKQNEFIAELNRAFGGEPNSEIELRIDELRRRLNQMMRNGEGEKGTASRAPEGAEGTDPEVEMIRPGELVGSGGRVTFAPGSAELTEANRNKVVELADRIRGYRNIILIKGHTAPDDLPEGASVREHTMLSVQRAQAIADELMKLGVSPDILRVQGCGAFEPIRTRVYTAEERAVNRRVEIQATDQLASDVVDAPAETPLQRGGTAQPPAAAPPPTPSHHAGH